MGVQGASLSTICSLDLHDVSLSTFINCFKYPETNQSGTGRNKNAGAGASAVPE
jgi:hypothetical protein